VTSLSRYDLAETVQQLRDDLAGLAVASLEQAFAAPKGFYVYCLWGEDPERPLYVGKSANVFNRLSQHAAGRGTGNGLVWSINSRGHGTRTQVTRVTLLKCETREIMEHVEVELIARLRPDHNHAQKPRGWNAGGRRGMPESALAEMPPPPEAPPGDDFPEAS
jgi:hypothetical protein